MLDTRNIPNDVLVGEATAKSPGKDFWGKAKALEDELTHRNTERAANLRQRVWMRLNKLGIHSSPLA